MTLAEAEQEARRARAALSRMENQAAAVRENGGRMPPDFWEAFGDAFTAVRLAERKVSLLREDAEKGR